MPGGRRPISFTVETDGTLPSGESLRDAIDAVDADAAAAGREPPAYFMLNCAHPSHFERVLGSLGERRARLRGLRANASRRSHAELDAATELDAGNPRELGADYARLEADWPSLCVIGGCCGTDHRHVARDGRRAHRPAETRACGLISVELYESAADLEQALDLVDLAAIRDEQDHVIVGLDLRVVMRHEHLVAANDRADRGAAR